MPDSVVLSAKMPAPLGRAYLTPRDRLYASMHPKRTLHLPREPVLNGFDPNFVALSTGLLSRGSFHLNISILTLVQLV